MIIKLYAQMNEYEDCGWRVQAVRGDEGYYDWLETDPTAALLKTIVIDEPSAELLLSIAEPAIDKMKERLAKARVEAAEKIKDFEAKFLLLGSK